MPAVTWLMASIGRAVTGLCARPLPVDHRLLGAARRGVVLGDQLRLRLHERGKRTSKTWATCWCTCCRVLLSNDA